MKYLKDTMSILILIILGIIFFNSNITVTYATQRDLYSLNSPFLNNEFNSNKLFSINNIFEASNNTNYDPITRYDNEDTYQEIQEIKRRDSEPTIVNNERELAAAINNDKIHYIKLGSNILMSNWISYNTGSAPPHDFVIDGDNNTKTLEGRGSNGSAEIYLTNSYYGKAILNNIHLRGDDFYGPLTTRAQSNYEKYSKTQIIYRNIDYVGAQLTASYYANVLFTGENIVDTSREYYVGINPNTGESNYTVGYPRSVNGKNPDYKDSYDYQENIEASSVTFDKNTSYKGTSGGVIHGSSNSGCFALGKYYNYDGRADIMDNANVNLNTTGPYYNWWNKATLNVNGILEVHPNANLNVNTNNTDSTVRSGYYNGIVLDNSHGVTSGLLIDKGAQVKANMTGPYDDRNSGASAGSAGGGPLSVSPQSKVNVSQYGSLEVSVDKNTKNAAPVINGADESIFHLEPFSSFSLNYKSDGTSSFNGNGLLYMGKNSNFNFERASSVNIEDDTKSYTGKKPPLIYSPDASLNVNTQNLYTWNEGNLNWGDGNNPWEKLDNYNDKYPSMFDMITKYNNQGYISSTGKSTYSGVADKFKNNFNTDKLQRIQYNYIPSVKIASFKQMTDSPTSLKISGHVETQDGYDSSKNDLPLGNALIRIQGHVKHTNPDSYWTSDNQYASATVNSDQPIPTATINSPVSGSGPSNDIDYTSNFNAKTDSNGDFSITLPKSLMASDSSDALNKNPTENGRIQVFAFKDGNYDNNNYAVDDVTDPKVAAYSEKDARVVQVNHPITDPKNFIKNYSDFSSDTNSNIWNKDVSFSFDNSKNPSDLWTSPGTNKKVYIKATDDAGNTTEVESYVDVYDTASYIVCNNSPVSMDIPKKNEKPSDWNTWAISENDVRAYNISNDGTGKKSDISDLVISNANESIYKKGAHTITYTLPSQYDAKPVEGIIIFNGTPLSLSIDGTDPLSFGPIQALSRNKNIKPKSKSYSVLVNGVDEDNKNDITLTAQADDFQLNSSQISPSDLDLGIVNNGSFNSLLNELVPLTKPDSISNGTYNYDLLNGNNKIILQNKGLLFPGTYETSITWTLSDTIK